MQLTAEERAYGELSKLPYGALQKMSTEERQAHKRAYKRAWRALNLEKAREYDREYNKEWGKNNKDKLKKATRKHHLKKLYGLTPEDVTAMKLAQANACFLCHEEKPLVIDHSHSTGKVRGLLCVNCNTGMGKLRHDPTLLRAAADYIEACRK